MVNEELIARTKAFLDLVRHSGWTPEREDTCTDLLDAILAALQSRPAPTEEGAREVLASIVEADDRNGGARPTSPLGKSTAYYIRDGQGAKITAWQAIRAMLRFATDTTPSRNAEGSVNETAFTAAIEHVNGFHESGELFLRAFLASYLAALKTSTPETQPVAGGEQCPVCGQTCWGHHDDPRLAPTTPERAKALEEALQAVRACRLPAMQGVSIHGPYETGPSWNVTGLTALLPMIDAALSACPPEVVEQ